MNIQKNGVDYRTYDSRYETAHSRPCIDGSITGSSKCIAYCECDLHPGFITEKLKAKHQCEEKQCIYYLPKPQKDKAAVRKKNDDGKQIAAIATLATSDMEGLRIMRATKEADSSWTVHYVAIADYMLCAIARKLAASIGTTVKFSKLAYRYEVAANLIFGVELDAA
jgi:hypothetical protein